MIVDLGNVFVHAGNSLFRLVGIELQDTSHLDFHQAEDVFFRHFTYELRIERSQPFVDVCAGGIHIFRLFELFIFINALFNEYLFKRSEMQAFL